MGPDFSVTPSQEALQTLLNNAIEERDAATTIAATMRKAAVLALQNCKCGGGHRLALLEKKITPDTPNPCTLCGPLWNIVDPPPSVAEHLGGS